MFKPGQSGNPGGRPKGFNELVEIARAATPKAMKELVRLSEHGKTEAIKLKAIEMLLDRGWGKPQQVVEHGGTDGGPVLIEVTFVQPKGHVVPRPDDAVK